MFAAGCMYFVGFQCIALRACGFFFLLHHILLGIFLCAKLYAVRKKYHFTLDFVAKIEKKRYNDNILRRSLGKYAMQFDRKKGARKEIFFIYGYL